MRRPIAAVLAGLLLLPQLASGQALTRMRRQPLTRAGIGLLSGAIPSERWERVSLEQRRVSFVAPSTGNGQGVGLRIAF